VLKRGKVLLGGVAENPNTKTQKTPKKAQTWEQKTTDSPKKKWGHLQRYKDCGVIESEGMASVPKKK